MSVRTYAATVRRVLLQLVADRRTVVLILVVPAALLTLLWYVYSERPGAEAFFNRITTTALAILPLSIMFTTTSVAMLRERGSGTLERLWTTPLHRVDLLMGYATAFTITAVGQSLIISAVCAWFLGVTIAASWSWVVLLALVDGFLGVSLGLFASAFARTEFQAAQFMPTVIFPQIFLCGLLIPRDQMPRVLKLCSDVLPMSWAVDAMTELGAHEELTAHFVRCLVLLGAVGVVILVIASVTVPRRTR